MDDYASGERGVDVLDRKLSITALTQVEKKTQSCLCN